MRDKFEPAARALRPVCDFALSGLASLRKIRESNVACIRSRA